uniref:Isoform C of General odorant-binding protein 84a n=1 Tax=Drosophila melanogaster TaxID=7227 RepID=P54194-2|nr:Odorant-binding protein 84a, isoform C [Drosophila melanogaster]ABW08613.2 Odorant-binding protein 84a, isoform C [Drosophila melanogaster]|eukprot:NP_001097700.2 Odorant-binding protein 84a, isoform C [Drosophila melanogaster]
MFHSLYLIGILSLIWVAAQDIVPDDPEVQMQMHAMFYTARVACADENLIPYVRACAVIAFLILSPNCARALQDHAKDNGDIFIINYDSFDGDVDDISTTTSAPREADYVDFDEVNRNCNASFITSMTNVLQFNNTGDLPDDKDKVTSMCYFHCFFEKSGLMTDYKLNTDLVRKYVWPATGDSVEACEAEGKDETNACMRGYAIVKCVFTRALTDARNKPTV